jgi:hypothetical protein
MSLAGDAPSGRAVERLENGTVIALRRVRGLLLEEGRMIAQAA